MTATPVPRAALRRRWLGLLLALCGSCLLAPLAWSDAALRCATCGKTIAAGRYLTDQNGKAYCSQACFEKTLPKCAVCGKTLTGKFVTANGGKTYCSQTCYATTLPKCEVCGAPIVEGGTIKGHTYCKQHAGGTRCAICGLPVGERPQALSDGRTICSACGATAVLTAPVATKLYELAQQDVLTVTGMKADTPPPLNLVWADALAKLMPASIKLEDHMTERGLYQREELTTKKPTGWDDTVFTEEKVTRRINLLLGQSPTQFRASAAHELTHDLTAEKYHALVDAPVWVQEGICQYVSAQVCRQIGAKDVLKAIEDSPDTVYGPGYRYFVKIAGKQGWPAVRKWMETTVAAGVSKLPAQCPEK